MKTKTKTVLIIITGFVLTVALMIFSAYVMMSAVGNNDDDIQTVKPFKFFTESGKQIVITPSGEQIVVTDVGFYGIRRLSVDGGYIYFTDSWAVFVKEGEH